MTDPKLIEAVASIVSTVMARDNHALAVQTAQEIITVYEAARGDGVVVPREITPAMREAIWRDQYSRHGMVLNMPAEIADECVRQKMVCPMQEAQDKAAYRAMIAAAKGE